MSKVDKNDLIYFKECCDKTYATSKNVDSESLVQQTVNGNNVFPKTKAKAVIMSNGKTLEETIQSGGTSSIVRVNNVAVLGGTSFTSTGSQQFNITLSPNNYNVEVESVEVVSDCSEITFSNITTTGFKMNINSVPSAINHKLTIKVKDKLGTSATKEVPFTVTIPATTINVNGSTELDASTGSATANYTVSYSPSYNVPIKSLQVTSSDTKLAVSNVTTSGFKLTATATEYFTATLTLTATTNQNKTITKTMSVNVNCGPNYDKIDDCGVAIMDINGRFYEDAAEWRAAGSPIVNGIAISDGTHRFCVSHYETESVNYPDAYNDTDYWGSNGIHINGVTATTDNTTAKTNFDGAANTNIIINNVKSSDGYFNEHPYSAAGICKEFTFPNSESSYLGSCGEWNLIQGAISTINTLINAIGGNLIDTNPSAYPYYWTCVQFSTTGYAAWRWNFKTSNCEYNDRSLANRIRAFCSF